MFKTTTCQLFPHPNFTDQETEAQRTEANYPGIQLIYEILKSFKGHSRLSFPLYLPPCLLAFPSMDQLFLKMTLDHCTLYWTLGCQKLILLVETCCWKHISRMRRYSHHLFFPGELVNTWHTNWDQQGKFKIAACGVFLERQSISEYKVFQFLKHTNPLDKPVQPEFIRNKNNAVEIFFSSRASIQLHTFTRA